ncbi:TPA: hypothetical protein SL686_005101 [Pseudomonas aeruginosa]|uniref:hypothetical protein n=1 Tax=Pseudomonas aeruginosa TaxID=287 RepID=UPI0003B97023|nr:hypothetical protein [Pseudomonas aeruginosa]ERV72655.1 hypothetical protein Q058_05142 [Pseudomonas aeruginosa BL04]MBG5150307.1 hypothetical protein [Pseudomonas aeruginosa]MDC3822267.1 hypothetical protein [Pseudomonas aeruginosa]HBO5409039.1 hypothetical protein [Pseudomonas aeruginosa]HBO5702639.1 hypothetical protein [Pseudomonas aeruginosa]
MSICNLCLKDRSLSKSHVIPKAFLRRLKVDSPQLIRFSSEPGAKPVLENANWTERLLCSECEKFLDVNYERKQIGYICSGNNSVEGNGKITFLNFDFEGSYLFWISIIWRASVSNRLPFSTVNLGPEVNEILRRAIVDKRVFYPRYSLSDIVNVGLVRVTNEPYISDRKIKLILSRFVYEKVGGSFMYYFMVEGFIVFYYFSCSEWDGIPIEYGRVKSSAFLRVPKIHVESSEVIGRFYNTLLDKAREFPSDS